jgi:hypothetical protein
MRPERTIDAYQPVIELIRTYLYGSDGQQSGDPRKAALAMIRLWKVTNCPCASC